MRVVFRSKEHLEHFLRVSGRHGLQRLVLIAPVNTGDVEIAAAIMCARSEECLKCQAILDNSLWVDVGLLHPGPYSIEVEVHQVDEGRSDDGRTPAEGAPE